MKIAVITYHYSNNKGAVMQTYGLCKFLRDYGYDIELIDIRQKESTTNLLVKIVKFFVVEYRMNKDMKTFYPPLTRRYGSVKELRNDPPKADCYIVGSDQVWNPNISKSLMMAVLLGFWTFISQENILCIKFWYFRLGYKRLLSKSTHF